MRLWLTSQPCIIHLVNNTTTNNPQSDVQPDNTVAEVSHSNTEIHESVQFSDQAPVQDMNISNTIVANNPYHSPTLEDYLSRVYPVGTFNWSSSDTAGSKTIEVILPDVFYTFRAISEKLSRFAFLKCGFHISVRVNGTKFHYGKLLVAFNVSSYRIKEGVPQIDYAKRDNIWSVSAYPHVICDAGENEVQEFDIPYLYPLDYYPLDPKSATSGYNTPLFIPPVASVFAYVLNPLSAGSGPTPDVSVTIYANMTDIKLAGYGNSIPVSVQEFVTKQDLQKRNESMASMDTVVKERSHDQFVAQIGTSRQRLAMPDLNNTVDDGVENDVSSNHPTVRYDFPSAYESNSLIDIVSKEALLYTGVITSSDGVGTDVYSWNVNPTSTSALTYLNGTVYYETPLSYIATMFNMWRGSINYKLQFVASQFHSLRLQLIYVPNGSSYETTEPFELLSRVIDIQRDTEFKFSIPYTNIFPYTNGSYGRLYMKVVNPLTFKETPVPDIYFNIWISGGSDMEFHIPITRPVYDDTTPSNVPPLVAQIGTTSETPHSTVYESLAPFDNYTPITSFSKTEMSDLIKKSTLVANVDEPFAGGTNIQIVCGPEGGSQVLSDSRSNSSSGYDPYLMYLSRIFRFRTGGLIYTLMKYTNSSTIEPTQFSASAISTIGGNAGNNTAYFKEAVSSSIEDGIDAEAAATFVQRSSDLGLQPLVVKLPYYLGLNMALTAIIKRDGYNGQDGFRIPRTMFQFITTCESLLYVSGADDSRLHFQLGPPYTFVPTP